MTKLYLFRHGETDWNKEEKIQCSQDIPLNETGIEQAKHNAELLKNKGIQHIYSSPLKRAYTTGKILADLIGVEIEIVQDLKEMCAGKAEGMFKKDYKKAFGEENYEIFYHTRNDGMDLRFEGGESKKEMRERFVGAVKKICSTTPYEIIGIAAHGLILREFLRALDFEDDSGLKNCETIETEFDGSKINIIRRIKE